MNYWIERQNICRVQCSITICFPGVHPYVAGPAVEGENTDRKDINLPGKQLQLLQYAVNYGLISSLICSIQLTSSIGLIAN